MFEEQNSTFYDWTYYESMERRYITGAHQSKIRHVFSLLGSLSGKRILDIGCGGGFFVEEARKRNAEVVGVDYSEAAITFAHDRFPKCDTRVADAYTLSSFEQNQFDIVMLIDVIEHISDQERVIKEVSRILKCGGCVLISTDLEDSAWNKEWMKPLIWASMRLSKSGREYIKLKRDEAGDIKRKNYHASHIGLLTSKEIYTLLKQNNFGVTKYKVYPLVGVYIRDLILRLFPKRWRGEHQVIVAINSKC